MNIVDAIIKSMRESPESWSFNGFTCTNGKIDIWVSNGFLFLSIYRPCKYSLGLFERIRLIRAMRILKKKLILNKLN